MNQGYDLLPIGDFEPTGEHRVPELGEPYKSIMGGQVRIDHDSISLGGLDGRAIYRRKPRFVNVITERVFEISGETFQEDEARQLLRELDEALDG